MKRWMILMLLCFSSVVAAQEVDAKIFAVFPQDIVQEVLVDNGVDAEKANQIATSLAGKDQEIFSALEQKVTPEMMKDESKREEIQMIFSDVVLNVFAQEMSASAIKDKDQVLDLLIQVQKKRDDRIQSALPQQ